MRRKLTVFATLFLLMGIVVACGDQDAAGSESGATGFSIMAPLHTPEAPEDTILNKLEEETSTNIEMQWIPDSTYADRVNTAFATNSLADAVYLGNITIFNQFKDAMRDDQFWEIGPYLDDYENLSKLKPQILENSMVDGKIYTLYQGRPLSRQGIIYRKDWADNLGLDTPTTTEEFYEMARAFTEDDPDGNGEDDTFGISDRSDLVYGAFKTVASWFGTPNNFGVKDGEIVPEFMYPEYKETLDYFKDLHSNGYINQDFPVTSKPDQKNFIKNGTAGIYVGAMGDVISLYKDTIELNPDAEFDVQNNIKGPDGEFGVWAIPGFGSGVVFPKSAVKTEEELKEILAFYDSMMSTELANLSYWGIEDEHYTVSDGGALPVEDQAKVDREVKPFQSLEIGEPDTNGRYEGAMEYETKAKAEKLTKDNENHLINDPTVTLDSKTFVQDGSRLQQIITDESYKYILGQTDEAGFEAALEKWKAEGGQDILDEFNASYQENK
ncbi:extracellular solute-binding protein [Aquibacillus sp. LR5S19]|uniref:Extracellular solute-binding protein n=2 Tax=Aquibacillus rhizosphaerae TaxID=3051431 RepID=A0ABT7LBL4_9BACI|nr:extracellular solute-binding protein [Aquibacillus sp. LR5S19]MDL4843252.1 extracellular solute-binding protein [Aquibacillus sp. LR5S19]